MLLAALALVAPRFEPGSTTFVGAGLATGVTETATGVGGPPLALAYQHASGPTLRATVATCFLVGEVVSLVVLGAKGLVELDHLRWTLALLPALLVGSLMSSLVHHRLDGPAIRALVLGFALVSGLVLIVRAL